MTYPGLIDALRDSLSATSGGRDTAVIETHISWVLLTTDLAFKIKKPVNLGFLNYSTLEARRVCCHAEVRLNARLAPRLYLGVVNITHGSKGLEIEGSGSPVEYAVKMRRFDQSALLDAMLRRQAVSTALIDEIADRISAFHLGIARGSNQDTYGSVQRVSEAAGHNFTAIRENLEDDGNSPDLSDLEAWTRSRLDALAPKIAARKRDGCVRECHGDMHLGNIALVDGEVTIFDGIEFNPDLRWIDVASEIAFITMDLDDRGARGFAQRLLNRYLQATGDYGSLRVLRFYQVYRALVRAKVEAIRFRQSRDRDANGSAQACADYIRLAREYTRALRTSLVVVRGVSGSGKSTLSQALAARSHLIWVRSDTERRRLFGLSPFPAGHRKESPDMYSREAGDRTYENLERTARTVLQSGFPVLVDATFLDANRLQGFSDLATRLAVPLRVVETRASPDTLSRRVRARHARAEDPSDADDGVLRKQLAAWAALDPSNYPGTLQIDTEHTPDTDVILNDLGLDPGFQDPGPLD